MYQHRAPPSIEDQGYAGHLTSLPFEEFVDIVYYSVDNESCWRMISLEFLYIRISCVPPLAELVVAHRPYNLCTTCNLPMTGVVLVDSTVR